MILSDGVARWRRGVFTGGARQAGVYYPARYPERAGTECLRIIRGERD
jgi:hypothetical protein